MLITVLPDGEGAGAGAALFFQGFRIAVNAYFQQGKISGLFAFFLGIRKDRHAFLQETARRRIGGHFGIGGLRHD